MGYCEGVGFSKRGKMIFSLVVSWSLVKSLILREEAILCNDFAVSGDKLIFLLEI